jgi:hypothetical protein
MCGHKRKDRIRNEVIRDKLGVVPVDKKLVQHQLRWFGHIKQRPPQGILRSMENTRRGRGRPKLKWAEAVNRDLRDWNVPKDLFLDRTAWKSPIHVLES